MKLSELVVTDCVLAKPSSEGLSDPDITGVVLDSRQVQPGSLFAALPGEKLNGARFAAGAVAAGAVALLAARDANLESVEGKVPILRSANPRRALAIIAKKFFARQPQTIVAVTGTSGKTSVADFVRQIFRTVGHQAASVGTIGVVRPDGSVYGGLTTPDPVTLHKTLAGLADDGVTHLAFEASSHGLHQHRLDGVRIAAAGFTNLGRDHLDYHPTVEEYFAAKLRLFSELLEPGQTAVVNMDGEMSSRVAEAAIAHGLNVLPVGGQGGQASGVMLLERKLEGVRQNLTVLHAGIEYRIALPLIGGYQVENALVAAGLAIAVGEAPEQVFAALEALRGVPGRLEIVGEARGGLVVVDYAHKPEALSAALSGVRPFVTGKLVCVFGCGGDRDRGKRPIMGAIAGQDADVVIVTDDNPRTEDPAFVRSEILAASAGAREIGDRREAIETAIDEIGPGDVILIAGKGHETGQIVGDKILPFSDQDVARAALERIR